MRRLLPLIAVGLSGVAVVLSLLSVAVHLVPHQTLRAERIVLVDEDGRTTALLSGRRGDGVLLVFDREGRPQVGLRMDARNGPQLMLAGNQHSMSIDPAGLAVRDKQGDSRVHVFLGCALESPRLILGDLAERTISLQVLERGGVLEATNASGVLVAGLEADEDGRGLIYVRDAGGQEVGGLRPEFQYRVRQHSDSPPDE